MKRSVSIGRAAALLVLAGAPALGQGAARSYDPEAVEARAAAFKPFLKHLEAALEAPDAEAGAALADPVGACSEPPAAEVWTRWERGRISGASSGPWSAPTADPEGEADERAPAGPLPLIAAVHREVGAGATFRDAAFKVIAVRASEGNRTELTALLSMRADGPRGRVQVGAELVATCAIGTAGAIGASDESSAAGQSGASGAGAAEVLALAVTDFRVARAPAPLFVERTRGVLAGAPEAAALLAHGGAEWARRLDDATRSAWFGHQGIAAGDVDGDGREDLFVGMPNGLPNLLLVQQADGTVVDRAKEAGIAWYDDTKGALLADLDGDGDRDLVLALHHVLVVHRNDGRGNFRVAHGCAAPDEAPFYSLAAADYDGDGDLDLYGARYVKSRYGESLPVPLEDARNGPSNHLFRNDGERFTDVTRAVGLGADNGRFSLAATFVDFDGDGDPDLYVANDFGKNQLFRNDGGRFTDAARALGVEDQAAGMGVTWSDFDRDGDFDLYVSNMYSSAGRRIAHQPGFMAGGDDAARLGVQRHALGNSLFVQGAEGRFLDASDARGVRMGRWAWGALFTDLDGDGCDDLVSPNGFISASREDDL